ncbi:two-component system response regulator ArlR [Hydrogenivirga caldilitoris]|uniref:Two-component system response regulator ArlR n=1 Tax=Hydrogenivirga caldilitoris TaxID=246264 RepID=A0A497XTP5_9AQUI|nr:response regulator transcription factor [Hydrogenivirga caldilitoris]RLJ71459.1 two-component system response regulator ArlR [Hydrogenivirga caldilitoris]
MDRKILLVEDDISIGEMLLQWLTHEGFSVDWVRDGLSAVRKALECDYTLVLLDLMLPRMDGLKVCRRIRETRDTPIIILTAKSQVEDKVEGLQTGADDYITKPFSLKELSARIKAVLRRYGEKGDLLKVGDLVVSPSTREVTYRGEVLNLTRREFELLKFLAENVNTALSRERIYARVWGGNHEEGSNIVDVYIKNLRRKLGDREHTLIKTVRGWGYMLKGDVNQV